MWTTTKTDVSKDRLDMEQHMKAIMKDDVCMKLYNKKGPLYPETDTLGVGLGAGLLQVWGDLRFPWNEAPDNPTLHYLVFACK